MTDADLAELVAWIQDPANPRPFCGGLAIDG